MRTLIPLACILFLLLLPGASIAQPTSVKSAAGELAIDKDVITVMSAKATLVIGAADAKSYRLTAQMRFADKATSAQLQVMPSDVTQVNKFAAFHSAFYRDASGLNLVPTHYFWDAKKSVWDSKNDIPWYNYWPMPTQKDRLEMMKDSGLTPRNLKDHWLRLRVEVEHRTIRFWLDGLLVGQNDLTTDAKGPVVLHLGQGDQLRNVVLTPLTPSLYLPVDITPFAHDQLAMPLGKEAVTVGVVPFEFPAGGSRVIDLSRARWIEQQRDPSDYYENYEGGPPVIHDPRMPLLRVPLEDYVAVHLLATADISVRTTSNFTLRAGRFGYSDQVVFHSFAATAPFASDKGAVLGPYHHVRIPWTQAFAQDLRRWLEIELTKEVRLARRQPDPCRFRSRPLGLPSGVKIAALTLERSPLQMRVTSKETGHAFVQPATPTFQVFLKNVTPNLQHYRVDFWETKPATSTIVMAKGSVPAGESVEISLKAPHLKLGYHDIAVTLQDPAGRTLLERRTSCCLLPPDTRKHRDKSPFGTWDFCGGHFTPDDGDVTGPLYVKLGLRWGMPGFKPEMRKKYGILPGNEPNIYAGGAGVKQWEAHLKHTPDQPPTALLFHETSISGRHLTRIPELFSDLPTYKFDDADQKAFKSMFDDAARAAKDMRAKYPKVHLRLGNGALPTREAMYQAKFPAELFDSAGNESPSFGRPPEAQPPDCVAFNASILMDRRMLDHYGYKDKPVSLCLETCYPAANPGNLTQREQADYLVRHALHALAWGMPEIKLGQICDMGNGYYFSNWGSIGFVHAKPELNVKPSFVAVATMTRVLDGAKFERVVPMKSTALYGLEFKRPDGSLVQAFWTLRGTRTVSLRFDRAGPRTVINDQGIEKTDLDTKDALSIELTPSPIYVIAGRVASVGAFQPTYTDKPAGKSAVLAPLADLNDWTIETGRDPELEYYDFMCPRRKGRFLFEPMKGFQMLKMTPMPIKHGKDTMPMYASLAHNKGIPIPGTPTEIGAWVNGNAGWGRLIFEFTDASGQRWISLGAEQSDAPKKWIEQMVPPDMLAKWKKPAINDWNTGDVFGISRINFDGWRWLAFPMPGNYPGEKHPWPANSQWRWDKGGIVHYPLTFRRLIVEMPEKVLHMKTYAPPPRPEIYLRDLSVGQDPRQLGYVLGPDR